jgi:hypothetical protein
VKKFMIQESFIVMHYSKEREREDRGNERKGGVKKNAKRE